MSIIKVLSSAKCCILYFYHVLFLNDASDLTELKYLIKFNLQCTHVYCAYIIIIKGIDKVQNKNN